MERRVLLAITLSFLVLFLYQRFVLPPPPARPGANATAVAPTATTSATPGAAAPPSVPSAARSATSVAPPAPAAVLPAILVGDDRERQIAIETTTVRATFTNRGARLVRWTLKMYKDDAGQPLELVPEHAGADAARPFSLLVDDPATTAVLNGALYRVSMNGADPPAADPSASAAASVDATAHPATIAFEMTTADGLTVKKTFTLAPTGYVVTAGLVVEQGGQRLNPMVEWGPGLSDDIARAKPASFFSPSYNTPAQAIVHRDGKVERFAPASSGAQEGPLRYAGVDDHYFVSIVLNDQQAPVPLHIEYAPVLAPQPDLPEITGRYVRYAVRFAAPRDQVQFFFGPKAFDDLRAIHAELTRVINYGIFAWLAVPLLGALKWVYGYVGNWGWSIIVLTILINLAMFPLRHKSVVSMRKMQELQPQLKAIQDRYAKYKMTDPERQKMNSEVMELYKSKGVNPASGCVPMLLTLPFLFAFYSMLSQSIEIRGAYFIGWITNLSAPDPWFVSPVLMGLTMWWQQKMTPTTMDPTQQKVMMFMPAMFTLMSFSFPSGLVIYWLVSNLWGIGQQKFTNYLIGPPKMVKNA
jgi:YidC/Oxa1 family membrane protein insertase